MAALKNVSRKLLLLFWSMSVVLRLGSLPDGRGCFGTASLDPKDHP